MFGSDQGLVGQFNEAIASVFESARQFLLPLDAAWRHGLAAIRWPTATRPEVMPGIAATMPGFAREHLFISLPATPISSS